MEKISLKELEQIVCEAGSLIKDKRGRIRIEKKEGYANFVTEYDLKVQKYLIEKLSAILPEAAFLGEEGDRTAQDVHKGFVFIIDPIDGTSNFICGLQSTGISVALSLDGEIIMGCVYDPFRKQMFSAERGRGAYLNREDIRIKEGFLSDGLAFLETAPYDSVLREPTMKLAEELSYKVIDLRILGSAALALCYIACGTGIAFVCPRLRTWDYAASSLIIEEAEGVIYGFDGRNLNLNDKTAVAASSVKNKEALLAIVRKYADDF